MPYKVGMVSLGCPKNQVDAEMMLDVLRKAGFLITTNPNEADIVIINTCGFIESAKQEAIDTILEFADLKNAGVIHALVVTGCLAERYQEEVLREMPEIDAVVSIGANSKIAEICKKAMEGDSSFWSGRKEMLPLNGGRVLTTPSYYAYLKIAEGCNNRCAYCAIPLIRGNMRSRRVEDILLEARGLVQNGVKELIVVAQDTTRYGEDLYGKPMLSSVLRELCRLEGLVWIRILYCYPERVTDDLLEVMAEEDKILPYMDLPIQHCNGRILKKMNRRGNREELLNIITKIRERVPNIVLRTTVMTGFPTETEEEFAELEEFIQQVGFDRLGCFAFSPEEDTPAYEMEGQVEEEIKLRRQEAIMLKQLVITENRLQKMLGEKLTVLVEGFDIETGQWYGRSYLDAPEIDGQVIFTSGKKLNPGDFVTVTITGSTEYDLTGENK